MAETRAGRRPSMSPTAISSHSEALARASCRSFSRRSSSPAWHSSSFASRRRHGHSRTPTSGLPVGRDDAAGLRGALLVHGRQAAGLHRLTAAWPTNELFQTPGARFGEAVLDNAEVRRIATCRPRLRAPCSNETLCAVRSQLREGGTLALPAHRATSECRTAQ